MIDQPQPGEAVQTSPQPPKEMTVDEWLVSLPQRRADLVIARDAFVVQANQQIASMNGQIMEIDLILSKIKKTP